MTPTAAPHPQSIPRIPGTVPDPKRRQPSPPRGATLHSVSGRPPYPTPSPGASSQTPSAASPIPATGVTPKFRRDTATPGAPQPGTEAARVQTAALPPSPGAAVHPRPQARPPTSSADGRPSPSTNAIPRTPYAASPIPAPDATPNFRGDTATPGTPRAPSSGAIPDPRRREPGCRWPPSSRPPGSFSASPRTPSEGPWTPASWRAPQPQPPGAAPDLGAAARHQAAAARVGRRSARPEPRCDAEAGAGAGGAARGSRPHQRRHLGPGARGAGRGAHGAVPRPDPVPAAAGPATDL